MADFPQSHGTFYPMPEANSRLTLYEGTMLVEQSDQRENCDGQVHFEWLPSLGVRFSIECKNVRIDIGKSVSLHIPGSTPIRAFATRHTFNGKHGVLRNIYSGFCDEPIVFHSGEDMRYVIFHLVNFTQLMGSVISSGSQSWMGRATADFGDWNIEIDTLSEYRELSEQSKSTRGYAITHVARLERTDGSLFTHGQAKNVLSGLFWFLSFARGLWSPPVLPVGFDSHGNQVWQEWQALRATGRRTAHGWLSDRQFVSTSLREALRGFWKRWNDPIWNDPNRNNTPLLWAIHWFVSANTDAGGVEGCVILAQTGLEVMAWVTLVEDLRTYTEDQFDKKSAGTKFEELLRKIGVDDRVPPGLSDLIALSNSKKWTNGPRAIASYRNTIVHTNRRAETKDVDFPESNDVLQLALWYLELSLLQLFGYNGHYMNRVQSGWKVAGVTELVPWSTL